MDGFRFVHRERVRFRDLDGFGHVNNAVRVEIGVRPARLGTKSFDLEYELRAGGRVVAQARTVLVSYDYDAGATIELPDEWRRSLAA